MARVPLADYSIRNCYLKNMSQLCEIMLLLSCIATGAFTTLFIFISIGGKYTSDDIKNQPLAWLETIETHCLGEQCVSIIISFK